MATLRVEVIYAVRDGADAVSLELPAGATVRDAIMASGMLVRHPEIDFSRQECGVFGKSRPLDAQLRDGDRLEIYRPLAVDPKEARRRRARSPRV
jgi:putative ubiquitin-RnfH superfamily antitoxin RatB of RatAB toxin-antitoxin module